MPDLAVPVYLTAARRAESGRGRDPVECRAVGVDGGGEIAADLAEILVSPEIADSDGSG
jgi:hypothetical protein